MGANCYSAKALIYAVTVWNEVQDEVLPASTTIPEGHQMAYATCTLPWVGGGSPNDTNKEAMRGTVELW